MTHELREAATRLVHATDPVDITQGVFVGHNRIAYEDIRSLAVDYLAEHPADDDERVSGDWLLSQGFSRTETEYYRLGQMAVYLAGAISQETWRAIFGSLTYSHSIGVPFRRNVRALAKALEVEMVSVSGQR